MGYTYGGHPVAAAVAVETLKIYESDDILGHVRKVSTRFMARLNGLNAHPLVGEARGVGLIGGVEIVKNKATKEQYPASEKVAAQVAQRCVEHGLILRPLPGEVIGICPPLIITEGEIDQLFDRLKAALDDVSGVVAKAA